MGLSRMTTIRCFRVCIFLTSFIVSLSGFKIFNGEGEALLPARRSDPELIRSDGIMRSLRSSSEPIFEQGILRKLKRSANHEFTNRSLLSNGIMRSLKRSALRNVHTDGLLRSVRSVDKRSLVSIPRGESSQDDEQTTYFMDEKQANMNRGLRSALRSIGSSLIPNHPYDGLALRYL